MACYAAAAPLPASRYNHGETYSALCLAQLYWPAPCPLPGGWPDLHLFPILLLRRPARLPGRPARRLRPWSRGLMAPASRGTASGSPPPTQSDRR